MSYSQQEFINKYIPSPDVQKELQLKNRIFTEYEMASVVYHSCFHLHERIDDLLKIVRQSEDVHFQEEVTGRVLHELFLEDRFKKNNGKYAYELTIYDKDCEPDGWTYGVYRTFNAAASKGKEQKLKYSITKHYLADENDPAPDVYVHYSPDLANGPTTVAIKNENTEVAKYTYDKDGNIIFHYSNEGSVEEFMSVESTKEYKRFEDISVSIPHPFKVGDKVVDIKTEKLE